MRAQTHTRPTGIWLHILGLLVLLYFPCQLTAQIDSGGITGTVHDSSGAVMVGTRVTLTNEATAVNTTTLSTSTGTYVFDAVKPGSYTIEASAPNFQTYFTKGAIVHVQQILTIDITLAPGSAKQEVTVTTDRPAPAGGKCRSRPNHRFQSGERFAAQRARLGFACATFRRRRDRASGKPQYQRRADRSAYFSVNGVNLWQNDIRLNGINDNIEVYGGSKIGTNATITPPPDAIEEFKLQSGDFNAEFGHSTGGIVNAVTKSGTNRLNGDLWEYFRNDDLQANDYFSKLNGKPIGEYRQNQFGGTLGGPISIPGLYNGNDKSFFFLAYQGFLNRQALSVFSPSTSLLSTVPTATMQNSNFTNLQDLITDNSGSPTVDALGRTFPLGTILDPATTRSVAAKAPDPVTGLLNSSSSTVYVRDPFYAGSIVGKTNLHGDTAYLNQLPAGRLDPNAIRLLQLYPLPTTSGFANNFFYNPVLTNNEESGRRPVRPKPRC